MGLKKGGAGGGGGKEAEEADIAELTKPKASSGRRCG
jgi:hypothetical protein